MSLKLLAAYVEIESNYALRKWKASELDAGHFVEAARRIIEFKLFGSYTPIGTDLPKFTDGELKRYEQASGGHADEFRILIPRVLKSIYGIRNKRNVAHIGIVSPNEMDATLILYSTKWVLAEFLRQASGMSLADAQKAVDTIIERRLSLLWKHNGLTRVLHDIGTREQVLVLLYDENGQSAERLQTAIEYKNGTNFRKILARLHSARLIEHATDGTCTISPSGLIEAEGRTGMLCLACVERRLGRSLNRADFNPVPVNDCQAQVCGALATRLAMAPTDPRVTTNWRARRAQFKSVQALRIAKLWRGK